MIFLHTGDLHIGKTVNEFSMIEDQRYILGQIEKIAKERKVDAVVIAGDVYDRPIPSTDAVKLLDDFLTSLIQAKIPVIMISGNHDSGERVAFADQILEKQGLSIAGGFHEKLKTTTFTDEWGQVEFVSMPFIKPGVATVETMLATADSDADDRRRVLITHYFVTGEDGGQPELSDSESLVSVGGLDNVSAALFTAYDYVALGHIHKRQKIGKGQVWYAGAPLKYSFSEVKQSKSVNIVTLKEKGNITVEQELLIPLHEMRIIRGELKNLLDPELAMEADREDYIKAELTDTEELIDPIGSMRSIYPNVMQIELLKNTKMQATEYVPVDAAKRKTTGELFADFYEMLRGEPMDEKRRQIVEEMEEATV